jgi:glucose/arabinose dehydrogenase
VVSDLDVTTFISGLANPWDIAWLPNGTVLVTERPGRLNVYVDGVDAEPFVHAPMDLVASGEGGMLGLEVDPAFSTNGYIYVCMCSNAGPGTDVRLVRFTLETPNGGSVVDRTDIVTGMPYSSGRHSGCRPRFGPDGYLWVGTGDAQSVPRPKTTIRLVAKCYASIEMAEPRPTIPAGFAGSRKVIAMCKEWRSARTTTSVYP